jgi:hypothetical protein
VGETDTKSEIEFVSERQKSASMAKGKPRSLKPVSTLVQACLREDSVVDGLLQKSILFL